MVVVSAGYVGGTRGSGIVSRAADVLGMSVVRGMRFRFNQSCGNRGSVGRVWVAVVYVGSG